MPIGWGSQELPLCTSSNVCASVCVHVCPCVVSVERTSWSFHIGPQDQRSKVIVSTIQGTNPQALLVILTTLLFSSATCSIYSKWILEDLCVPKASCPLSR